MPCPWAYQDNNIGVPHIDMFLVDNLKMFKVATTQTIIIKNTKKIVTFQRNVL